MSAVRCVACGWAGQRKGADGLERDAVLPKPCPQCDGDVKVGGPPPSSSYETSAGVLIEFWDERNIESGAEQKRRYRIDGERATSVTTITGMLDKSDFLIPWAVRLALAGENWRDVRDEAAKRGRSTHDVAVKAIGNRIVRLSELDAEHRLYAQAAMSWLAHRRPRVIQLEQMVASPEHGFAGRFDLLARDVLPQAGAAVARVDYKTVTEWPVDKATGKRRPPYPEHALQLDLYELGARACGEPTADYGLIVRLGPDGTFDEAPFVLDPERARGLLSAYRARSGAAKALTAGLPDYAEAAA